MTVTQNSLGSVFNISVFQSSSVKETVKDLRMLPQSREMSSAARAAQHKLVNKSW
jgi:hypothetical protein